GTASCEGGPFSNGPYGRSHWIPRIAIGCASGASITTGCASGSVRMIFGAGGLQLGQENKEESAAPIALSACEMVTRTEFTSPPRSAAVAVTAAWSERASRNTLAPETAAALTAMAADLASFTAEAGETPAATTDIARESARRTELTVALAAAALTAIIRERASLAMPA